ncbi:hypothetical protein GCM10009850_089790 [Nonomuraea monospora]|uniref:Transposase n=1 Tax=Nonomuraea monospora TaxID=568818 RepID=A0ABN3CVZ7_9ACTN
MVVALDLHQAFPLGARVVDERAFCFLRRRESGERFVRVKRRVTVNEWIEGFVVARG